MKIGTKIMLIIAFFISGLMIAAFIPLVKTPPGFPGYAFNWSGNYSFIEGIYSEDLLKFCKEQGYDLGWSNLYGTNETDFTCLQKKADGLEFRRSRIYEGSEIRAWKFGGSPKG